jgi:hypothetical protein
MKRWLISLAVLSFAFQAFAEGTNATASTNAPPMGTIEYLDWKYGFRGDKFGSPVSSIGSLASPTTLGGYSCYRSSDEAIIGTVNVGRFLYEFYKERLALIEGEIESIDVHDDADSLLLVFRAAYGAPTRSPIGREGRYEWEGKHVFLSFNVQSEKASFIIGSRVISFEKQQDDEAAAKIAAKNL